MKTFFVILLAIFLFGCSDRQFVEANRIELEFHEVSNNTVSAYLLVKGSDIDIKAWGLHVKYPTDLLQFSGYNTDDTLVEDWFQYGVRENVPGDLIVGGFDTSGSQGEGILLKLFFDIVTNGTGELVLDDPVDDISDYLLKNAEFKIRGNGIAAMIEMLNRVHGE